MIIPLLWRFIFKRFLKIFLLSFFGIIATLLIARAQDIAKFISIAPNAWIAIKFAFFQIPYIIPFALPISALISAYLLMSSISSSHELTALRASGLSLRKIVFPLIYVSFLFALSNFYVASELVPLSRQASRELIKSTAAQNPLVLLHHDDLIKMKHRYASLEMVRSPDLAKNVLLSFLNPKSGQVNLIVAKELSYDNGQLLGRNISVIAETPADLPGFNHLVIDNHEKTNVFADTLSDLLYKPPQENSQEFLPSSALLNGTQYEILRRFDFFVLPVAFALIGIAFGIRISRYQSRRPLLYTIALSVFLLVSFIAAKGVQKDPLLMMFVLYLPPAIVISITSTRIQKTITGNL